MRHIWGIVLAVYIAALINCAAYNLGYIRGQRAAAFEWTAANVNAAGKSGALRD